LGCNFIFSWQRSVFSHVAEQGDEIILTFLCASGKLDVETKDKDSQTPLLYAALSGHEAVVKLLLEKEELF
jgi:ankyrin repeat protein